MTATNPEIIGFMTSSWNPYPQVQRVAAVVGGELGLHDLQQVRSLLLQSFPALLTSMLQSGSTS